MTKTSEYREENKKLVLLLKHNIINSVDVGEKMLKEFTAKLKDMLHQDGNNLQYGNYTYGVIKSYEIDNLLKAFLDNMEANDET